MIIFLFYKIEKYFKTYLNSYFDFNPLWLYSNIEFKVFVEIYKKNPHIHTDITKYIIKNNN